MDSKELLLLFVSLGLLGGLRLTSTTTTTTFVAAMSIANQDLERYFRTTNNTQSLTAMTEERIAMDLYTYAFLNYSYVSAQHPEPVFSTYTEEKARYGEGRMFNVRGKLVHVTDAGALATDYACSPNILGTRGEPTPPPGVTWIALVRRGNCTFEEKVKNVHAKGAAGVIIYNDKQVTNLEKMQIKVKNRNITAVITFDYVGEEMARIVDQGNEMMAAIIEGRSGMRPINTLNRTSVLFVSISFIVLMIISLVWLIFYYIQRFRYLQTKDQQSRHLCSVTKKAIMKIPTKTGKVSDEKDADSDCCAICIEAYKPSDCIRVLPCKHEFHKNCIDPWLIEHRTCPMCKLDVLKFYGYVFLGSEESILEYEPDRVAPVGPGAAGVIAEAPQRPSALVDLIRSRDFVIDFPRIFVLEAGASAGSRDEFFPRSQSSLSLAHAKDWMSQMSNKLEEQQVLRRARKASVPYEMQENLLHVRSDSTRRLRSRSADGRYSSGVGGCFARQSSTDSVDEGNPHHGDVVIQCEGVGGGRPSRRGSGGRRNSSALRVLTDASYAQSIQRRHEEMQQQLRRTRRESLRRTSVGAASREMPPSREMRPSRELPPSERQEAAGGRGQEGGDVAIQIQVNGEGINF